MDVVGVLDSLAYHEKQIAYHQAQLIRVLAEHAIACEGDEFFDAEIAAAMRWTSRWTTDQIHTALDLVSKLPNTLDALEKGEIDLYKARVLHDKTMPLSPEQAAEVEERVLAKAPDQTGAQMRQLTNRVVMRVDPEGHKERAELRKAQRCTGIDSLEEDTARIWAMLPAHLATACYARVDAIARQVKTPTDPRTLDQVRADVFADLLLATPGKASAVKVELYVTVSAATLLGLSEQPGELAGVSSRAGSHRPASDSEGPTFITSTAPLKNSLVFYTEDPPVTFMAHLRPDHRRNGPRTSRGRNVAPPAHRPDHRRTPRIRHQYLPPAESPTTVRLDARQNVSISRPHPPGSPFRSRPHGAVPIGLDLTGKPRRILPTSPPREAPHHVGSKSAETGKVLFPQPGGKVVST